MKKLYTLTLGIFLFTGLYLGGCDATVTPNDEVVGNSTNQTEALSAAKKSNKGDKNNGNKIDICHYQEEEDSYRLINISAKAETAHRNHGDAQVSEEVPGMPGFTFDETCAPVETVACPCWDASELESVTAENQYQEGLSCKGLLSFPRGALIENTDFLNTEQEGGFAAAQVGVFNNIDVPSCLTRNIPIFLQITETEADVCIRQIAARCEAIGTPIPQQTASKGARSLQDSGSIFGSN